MGRTGASPQYSSASTSPPTFFWREGSKLYWHGSSASRMLRNQSEGERVCLTVAHLDSLVLAPREVAAWVEALRRVLTDAALRADLRARGLAQAARFTWEAAARQTLAVYGAVLEQRAVAAR